MPEEIAALTTPKPRPHQDYGWELVRSREVNVWPKLFHYRVSICSSERAKLIFRLVVQLRRGGFLYKPLSTSWHASLRYIPEAAWKGSR